MHPTLIRANIALYLGDYAEVRRLLGDYRAEGGGAAEYAPMAVWLDAQAQTEPDERLRRLESLLTIVPPDSIYARLAQTILDFEQPPAAAIQPPPYWARAMAAAVVVLVILMAGVYALVNRRPSTVVQQVQVTATAVPTSAPLPDRSRPLSSSRYSTRYIGGILQVTAVEDDSKRIVDREGSQVQPVPGARFFAVELAFECRIAICQQPPEADVSLHLADDSLIEPRDSVFVQNEEPLQAVALGVTTRGWVIFEIPSIIAVSGLDVTANDAEGVPVTTEIPLE